MISINKLSIDFGGFWLFNEISFLINSKDRIGLVGKNGAGKSTLLKILIKKQLPTEGQVVMPKDLKVGYLPQTMVHRNSVTVREEAESALVEIVELEKDIDKITHDIAVRTDYESDDYLNQLNILNEKNERYAILGGKNYSSKIELTLKGLGFKNSDFERNTNEFSGGWRMRIELAKILLQNPDVLLLDEPTNHLDIESIQWLEDYLKAYSGAVVLISHDKAFLDNITTRTVEISLGKIYDYNVPYSKYLVQRKERYEQQLAAYNNQQKKIEDTEAFIERFRYKATKAVQVQSRIKQLDKLERVEIDDFDTSALRIKFPPAPHSGVVTVKGKNVSKSYGDHLVIEDIDFELKRGEKVAFVGKNGEGKTTLAKVILNQLEHSGVVELGHQVKIGYFAQDQAMKLDNSLTVFETVDKVAVGDIRTKIRDILGAFLFGGEAVDKKVSVLSGGERTRLAMVLLLLEPVNFLILDEPTNHLDIRSKDILKQALKEYQGTLLLVSHDRDFLDGLVDTVYEFTNRKLKVHLGGIYAFLENKRIESLQELNVSTKATETSAVKQDVSNNKLLFEQRKELNRELRKTQNNISTIEKKIDSLEEKKENLNQLLQNPEEVEDINVVYKEFEDIATEIDELMEEWSELTEIAEEIEAKM